MQVISVLLLLISLWTIVHLSNLAACSACAYSCCDLTKVCISFESQNMAFGSDPQPLFRSWGYSNLHTGVVSALTGKLNIKCTLA